MEKEENLEKIEVDKEDLKEVYEKFGDRGKPDIICIGCPHASISEIKEVALILKGKKLGAECYILTSKPIKSLSDRMGYTKIIEMAGGKIVCDTCPILTAKESMDYDLLYTNSAKLAHYAPGVCDIDVSLLELKDCLVIR
jgi:predicted aconitase